jgi:Asp-tRNA(Asn)/Glu-tRNA(Gln) amidotransferase A subunit family amidase
MRELDIASMGAADIARAVNAGEMHPAAAVESALAALEDQRALNAVITVCADEALARARAGVNGRLAGVPLLVKDVFDTAGVRTTYGSKIYADHVPEKTAPAVLALEAEGAVMIAKANCDEFAWGVTGQNEHWGDAQNPRVQGRIAGGSSSGNGAALAARVCPLAIGTDTGGSVRMPAACCGVVGLKPRVGTISTAGVVPLCPSFDTVGPMARTVQDCGLAYSILTAEALPEPGLRGRLVGILTHQPALAPTTDEPERDVRALGFAERLEALGARAVEVELPVPRGDTWPVFYGEAAVSHHATYPQRRDDYGKTVRAKLDDAQSVDRATLASARSALADWREQARLEPAVDLFVAPTLGVTEIPPIDVEELEIRLPFSAYTRTFSYLGWPAIAIGEVQLAARDGGTLLAAALAWEEAYGSPA